MICPACGAMIDDNSKFCYVCGNPISEPSEGRDRQKGSLWASDSPEQESDSPEASSARSLSIEANVCPYCGWEIDFGQRECVRCGKPIPRSVEDFPRRDGRDDVTTYDDFDSDSQSDENVLRMRQEEELQLADVDPIRNGRESDFGREESPDSRKRIALIAIAAAAAVVVAIVALVIGLTRPSPEPEPEPEPQIATGVLAGHMTMSDAAYGTEDYEDAIVLDVGEDNNADLLYRGHRMTGYVTLKSEEKSTNVYELTNLHDTKDREMKGAKVTIEVPKTFNKDSIEGTWRICFSDPSHKIAISDWATVYKDGTGRAGFSYEFDIFTVSHERAESLTSRRTWKKTGDGRYQVSSPDANGVSRMIFLSQ